MISDAIQALKQNAPSQRWWVAYSGGLDSHVLLHALSRNVSKEEGIHLNAIHINHQLSPHANQWQNHCIDVCHQLNIPCQVLRVNAQPLLGESPEEAARHARYQAFSSLISNQDCLISAHHCDDQAETLLLQLFRGAGIKGLAAMPEQSVLGQGYLLRPFLNINQAFLREYAQQHQLCWIEDESNQVTQYDRNFLRHKVMPLLKARWPSVSQTLKRTSEVCAESDALMHQLIFSDLDSFEGSVHNTVSQSKLKRVSIPHQRLLLRSWLYQQGFRLPSRVKLEEVVRCVIHSRFDANPLVTWDSFGIRRYGDDIYSIKDYSQSMAVNLNALKWDLKNDLILPHDNGILRCEIRTGKGISINKSQDHSIEVRFRTGGERISLEGRHCSHALKKLFQQWRVAPWMRSHIPLITFGEQVIQVVGYGLSKYFAAEPDEQGYVVVWDKNDK